MVFSLCQLLIKDLYLVQAYVLVYVMFNLVTTQTATLIWGKYPFNKILQKMVKHSNTTVGK